MSNIYEGQYIVNSFNAIDADTLQPITPDERGYITATAGQKILFKDLYHSGYTYVNTIVFFTEDTAQKVQLNDNTMYPFYVEEGTKRGIKQMRIDSFTVLNDCTFYYEGIVCH